MRGMNQWKSVVLSAGFAGIAIAAAVAAPQSMQKVVGSGVMRTEARTVQGFHGVDLSDTGNLSIVQSNREGLTVEAEDNILPLIETRVENGILRIGIPRANVNTNKTIRYRLTVRTLDRLRASGAGSISTGPIQTARFDMGISGAGKVQMEQLKTDRLTLNLSGAGDAKVAGTATRQQVTISGAGSYNGDRFLTQDADLSLSGAGQARVHASVSLKATVSGAGSVRYSGSPTKTQVQVSGAGSVQKSG